jgi:hypothetical protein
VTNVPVSNIAVNKFYSMSPRLTGVVGDTEHVEVAGGGAEELVDGRSPPESSRRKVSNCQDLRKTLAGSFIFTKETKA